MAKPSPIVIVHGWSDKGKSFENLAKFIENSVGASVTTIDLADWVSLNDEITYKDLRFAMNRAWNNHPGIKNATNVRVVSHSTGALVVRDWMTHYYTPKTVPISRHIMLAPANFGSQLAHKGRTWYGRVFKGWKTGFQTGGHLLRGLELASPYSWNLAERDLLGGTRWYGTDLVMAAVLVGNTGYGGKAAVTDEVGGDGTVRVSTANIEAARLTIDFTSDGGAPVFQMKAPSNKCAFGLGISDGDNHSSVAFKKKNKHGQYMPNGPHTANWLVRALTVPPSVWPSFIDEMATSNAALMARDQDDEYFHGYQNTVVRVVDELENPVEEYLVEFHRGRSRGFKLSNFGARFQRDIIDDCHGYSGDSSLRSLYLDITTLNSRLSDGKGVSLELELDPEYRRGRAVGYPKLRPMELSDDMIGKFFKWNRTLLVRVVVPRTVGKEAFELVRQ